jgi:TorA maturation chaperone TorD
MTTDDLLADHVATITARQVLCRYAAAALVDPQTGSWRLLADGDSQAAVSKAAAILRGQRGAIAEPLARGELPLAKLDPAAIFRALPRSPDELNALYEKTFGLLVSSSCPPYATEYIDQKLTFERSHALADISGFYRAFGFEPSREHPERQDYLVLQLEFLASLLGLQRQARQAPGARAAERARICQSAYRRFLAEHVVWWLPTFARLLSLRSVDGFYAQVAQFLAAWTAAERAVNGIAPTNEGAVPSRVEPPDACEGCALQAAML